MERKILTLIVVIWVFPTGTRNYTAFGCVWDILSPRGYVAKEFIQRYSFLDLNPSFEAVIEDYWFLLSLLTSKAG